MAASPTQRTLEEMRKRGYPLVQVVEKWNPHAKIRQDLFGIIDVLCVGPNDIVAVQTTSDSHVANRIKKIQDSDALAHLRKANIRVLVHGWRKVGRFWKLREVDIS